MKKYTQKLTRGSPGGPGARGATVVMAALVLTVSLAAARAEGMKIVRSEGGINPNPVVTSANKAVKGLKLSWQSFGNQAPRGSNVVYTISKCPALKGTNSTWTTVATVTNLTTVTTDIDGENAFMQVQQDPAPTYGGAEKCGFCHLDTHEGWMTTRHAGAFQTLKNIKMDKNASCLPCHTVGYGTPTGFKDEATTPSLAGVQCESCHGPAGTHASGPLDKFGVIESILPVKTLSADMCGGCHTDIHHPTYDEWATSAHGTTQIPEEEFSDATNGPPRMLTCGACHSAATRLPMLNATLRNPDPTQFHPEMPTTAEASETGITCATCHDLHGNPNVAQLRFPTHSEMNYSYSTATNFAANFNPDVQTCAQCHNMRGATWTSTSRPPHHSPQYNILIGKGGFEAGLTNTLVSAHMKIDNQCAQCHTHQHSPDEITEATPVFTGHDFKPTLQACAPCHDEAAGSLLIEVFQKDTKQQIAEVKGFLDQWALTKAPDALKKYGALAWEFTSIGQLSTPANGVTTGPTTAEQKSIPDNIKQARFNLYLVEHDGSYGVHNGGYSRFLLKIARDKVKAEL